MSAIAPHAIERLWDDINRAIPPAVMSGIVGDASHSFGYHLARRDLPVGDYSVQLPKDKRGSGANASALDVSLPPELMRVVTGRLLHAAHRHDRRLSGLREFCGTLNGRDTYPWDLASDSSEGINSWDDSHLWHIHLSFFREYADNYQVLAPVADVMSGAEGGDDMPTAKDIVDELLKDENIGRLAHALMVHQVAHDGTTFVATVRQAHVNAAAAAEALNDPKHGVVVQLATVKRHLSENGNAKVSGEVDVDKLVDRLIAGLSHRLAGH